MPAVPRDQFKSLLPDIGVCLASTFGCGAKDASVCVDSGGGIATAAVGVSIESRLAVTDNNFVGLVGYPDQEVPNCFLFEMQNLQLQNASAVPAPGATLEVAFAVFFDAAEALVPDDLFWGRAADIKLYIPKALVAPAATAPFAYVGGATGTDIPPEVPLTVLYFSESRLRTVDGHGSITYAASATAGPLKTATGFKAPWAPNNAILIFQLFLDKFYYVSYNEQPAVTWISMATSECMPVRESNIGNTNDALRRTQQAAISHSAIHTVCLPRQQHLQLCCRQTMLQRRHSNDIGRQLKKRCTIFKTLQ
ncbi:hypothetical protein JKP88DRAFT_245100 [Tribonema minus]|uniref:Uncharacterized protein n=1 Tax=Tribonema minus TaxID=303371 RepID=A0A835Z160_9STRA|nr:hypothetical protein JKP88DRAFT_245100 [Tribonema minus]